MPLSPLQRLSLTNSVEMWGAGTAALLFTPYDSPASSRSSSFGPSPLPSPTTEGFGLLALEEKLRAHSLAEQRRRDLSPPPTNYDDPNSFSHQRDSPSPDWPHNEHASISVYDARMRTAPVNLTSVLQLAAAEQSTPFEPPKAESWHASTATLPRSPREAWEADMNVLAAVPP